MKKKPLIILGLCFIVAAVVFVLWQGRQSDVPTQEEIIATLTEQGEEEAKKLLLGYSRQEIIDAWGTPDGMLSGFWGEIWETDNAIHITLYYGNATYGQDGEVTSVLFRPQAK